MRPILILIGLALIALVLTACGSEFVTPVSVFTSPGPATTPAIFATPTSSPSVNSVAPTSPAQTTTSIPLTAVPSNTALPAATSSPSGAASVQPAIATPTASNVIIAPTPTPENLVKPATAPQPKATVTPVPTLTPALDPKTALFSSEKPDAEEQSFLQQLNQYRQANGRTLLTFDPLLFKSARWLAQDMAIGNYVSHTDSRGRAITERIKSFGYPGQWVGENIAGGFEHAADNLNIWQSDDIHKNNLLGPNYTKAGVGRYYVKTSLNRWYWVLDMGQ